MRKNDLAKASPFFEGRRPAFLLIGLSILLLVTGLLDKQNQGVLRKAIYICLECIGIG